MLLSDLTIAPTIYRNLSAGIPNPTACGLFLSFEIGDNTEGIITSPVRELFQQLFLVERIRKQLKTVIENTFLTQP